MENYIANGKGICKTACYEKFQQYPERERGERSIVDPLYTPLVEGGDALILRLSLEEKALTD